MGEAIKFGRGKIELYKPTFADNSWSNIISACQTGAVPDTWKVGDQKAMTINGQEFQIDIIGKNHDTYSDGSGNAPLTFQMHDCYEQALYGMNSSDTNTGGWEESVMRTTRLPAILALMPSEVQAAIKEVNKKASMGGKITIIRTYADKLFLLSEIEIFGSITYSVSGEGSQYAYYSAGNSKVKVDVNDTNNAQTWWTRSPDVTSSQSFVRVTSSGASATLMGGSRSAIVPAFCF